MKLVVKPHRPVRKFLAIMLTVIVLVICGWLWVDYDQWQYIYARMTDNLEQGELLEVNRHLDKESQSLKERLVIAQRSSQIDQLAFREARNIIEQQESEILVLKQELAFYQQLMGQLGQGNGPVIQSLNMTKADVDHSRDYTLVLTHINRSDRVAKGRVNLTMRGLINGEIHTLTYKELSSTDKEALTFEFKRFMQLKGRLVWPENFQPEEIQVKVLLDKAPRKSHEKVFYWAELSNR